jgi:hypothetical protein
VAKGVQLASLLASLTAAGVVFLVGGSAQAITGGQPDGYAHPYVAYVDNGICFGSGTLLSPTVLLTVAHFITCSGGDTSLWGTNSVTGAAIFRVSFDPNLINTPASQRVWYFGTYYADPDFAQLGPPPYGQQPLPKGFFRVHDEAIVVLTPQGCAVPAGQQGSCGPIPAATTLGKYGQLPTPGLVDTLPNQSSVDIVGFGNQDLANGSGPCDGPCKRFPDREEGGGQRIAAQTALSPSNDVTSSQFIKLSASQAGICGGDSGGPDLLPGTNIILAVNSYIKQLCTDESYSYRVDTPEALNWVQAAVTASGGHL